MKIDDDKVLGEAVSDVAESAPPAEATYVGRFRISPQRWYEIEDNIRQRDTEAHAALAVRGHLSAPHPVHRIVTAARLPDGTFIKVEGHTRALLWQRGQLAAPDEVLVDVYDVRTRKAAGDLYDRFDNPATGKGARDRMFGAAREIGLELTTPQLRSGGYSDAARYAYQSLRGWGKGKPAAVDITTYFRRELLLLDSVHPTKGAFIHPVTIAALITLRRHGERAAAFWLEVQGDNGRKANGRVDGVQAIHDLVATARQKKDASGRRWYYVNSACVACEKWLAGQTIQTLRPMGDAAWKAYLAETAARRR